MYVASTHIRPDGHGVESARRQGGAHADNEDGSSWLFYNIRTGTTRFGDHPGSGNVVDRLVEPYEPAGDSH